MERYMFSSRETDGMEQCSTRIVCLIFPDPQFKTRFTPTTDENRRIDRILRKNLPAVIDTTEKYGVKDRLKSRNSLREYFCQY